MRFLVLFILLLTSFGIDSARSGAIACCVQVDMIFSEKSIAETPFKEKTIIKKSTSVAPRVHSDVALINVQVLKNFSGYVTATPGIQNFLDLNAKHLSCPKHHFW